MSLPEEVVRDVMRAAHRAAPPGPCPDADVLALYAEQALDGDERTGVEAHVAGCGRCQETLAAFVRSAPESTAVGAGGVGVVLSWWSGWRWLVPMAATAALVVVAVWVGRGPSNEVDRLAQQEAAPLATSADSASPAEAAPTPQAPPSAGLSAQLARRSPQPPAPSASPRAQAFATEAKELQERANAAGAAGGSLAKAAPADASPPAEEARKLARQEPGQGADTVAGARERDKAATLEDQMRLRQAAAAPAPPPPAAIAPPPSPVAPATPAAVAEAPAAGAQTPTFRATVPERRAEAADAAKPATTANATLAGSADAKQEAGRLAAAEGRADASGSWRLRDGRIERTLDAGRTWEVARLPEGFRPTAIAAPSPTVCWAIGPQGVTRTVDGRAWTRVTVPTAEPVRAIVATDATSATVTTASGARVVLRP